MQDLKADFIHIFIFFCGQVFCRCLLLLLLPWWCCIWEQHFMKLSPVFHLFRSFCPLIWMFPGCWDRDMTYVFCLGLSVHSFILNAPAQWVSEVHIKCCCSYASLDKTWMLVHNSFSLVHAGAMLLVHTCGFTQHSSLAVLSGTMWLNSMFKLLNNFLRSYYFRKQFKWLPLRVFFAKFSSVSGEINP